MAYSNFYARFFDFLGRIRMSFAAIFRFRPIWLYMGIIIFWQIIAWIQAWFIHSSLTDKILVLHYNVDFGIDMVGDPQQIYFYPILGLAVILINLIILALLHKDKNFRIIAHFLLSAAVMFGLFLTVTLLAVYLINFR